jgi:hypothetical protein
LKREVLLRTALQLIALILFVGPCAAQYLQGPPVSNTPYVRNIPTELNPNSPQAYQRRFDQGIQALSSDISQAISIFRQLYTDTRSSRVQLELARSLFLGGRLAESKVEFIDILLKDIPITVRDKVEWYISEIQKRDTAKFYVGVFQDSNPGQITASRSFNLFGQNLAYQPSQPTSPAFGLNLSAEVERELSPNSSFFLQVSAATFTYATADFNRQIADSSVIKRWQDTHYKDIRLGNELMFYGGAFLYNSPYVSSRWIFSRADGDSYGFFMKAASLNYPNYSYLNGTQTQVQAQYLYNATRNVAVNAELGVDRTAAQESAYSSYGMFASLGLQIAESATQLQANLKATVLSRHYWQVDPIWGEVRNDTGRMYSITVTKRDFYIFGLRPEVGYVFQSNNSSLPFYSYSKGMVGVFLKNVF